MNTPFNDRPTLSYQEAIAELEDRATDRERLDPQAVDLKAHMLGERDLSDYAPSGPEACTPGHHDFQWDRESPDFGVCSRCGTPPDEESYSEAAYWKGRAQDLEERIREIARYVETGDESA